MSEEKLSHDQIRYNEYSRQRGDLSKTHVDLGGRYDQWILTLTGGALVLSVTFLEKIAPEPAQNTVFMAGIAWLLLIVALLSGLISLLTAQYAAFRQIEIVDDEYRDYLKNRGSGNDRALTENPQRENKYNQLTRWLNRVTIATFVVGIFCLCAFAYANMPTAKTKTPVLPSKMDVNVTIQNSPLQTNAIPITQ